MASGLENIETIESPFRRFVTTIGVFPTAFTDAMTYYECLAYLVKYLEETVIPAVNQNAEAVEELQTLYIQLKSYVDNYFANLDVQEEINNKLDEMAEDGQLTQLIAQFLTLNAVMSFASVADLRDAENLVDGSTVETYGFYNTNDGGSAKYFIRPIVNTDVTDGVTLIALTNSNTLVAELVKTDPMNVRQFGAKGDGVTDDTTAIQKALDFYSHIIVPEGTYMVNAVTSIDVPSNMKLENNGIIKAIDNDQSHYAVLNLDDVDNVEISGGTIQGDKTTHTGATGEWGQCINIVNGCENINIHDIKLIDAWGDGLYINSASNVITSNVIIDNARRNGISIISVEGYTSNDDRITNISGTAPEAGVDIEPNANTNIIKNISFNGLRTSNTKIGIDVSLDNLDVTSSPVSIEVNNSSDHSSAEGIRITKSESVIGFISINSPKLIENADNAIQFRNARYNSNFVITVDKPYIYRTTITANQTQYSAIAIIGQYASGNITIKNPDIHQGQVSGNNIYDFRCNSTVNSDYIRIIDTLHHDKNFSVQTIDHMTISDGCNAFESITPSGAGTIGSYEYRSRSVRNAPTSTGDGTVTIDSTTPIGISTEFVNLSQGHYKIQLPAGTYCRAYSSSTAPLISIGAGGSLTLTRLNSTDFIASGAVGTINA